MKNEGKKFEEDFVNSIDQNKVFVKRLNDNAAGWSGGSNTRFSSNNECDFVMFHNEIRVLYALELKSTEHSSITFWREDFEDKEKKKTFMIRKCQIQGLKKWSDKKYTNGIFGLVINFRKEEKTYFVNIDEFINYTKDLDKKSINIKDILNMKPIEIIGSKKRTRFCYDTESFFNDTNL